MLYRITQSHFNVNSCFLQTQEELDKLTVDENLSDIDRSVFLLWYEISGVILKFITFFKLLQIFALYV